MKKIFFFGRLLFAVATVSFMISCGSSASYRDILPSDAFVVASANAGSMLAKSGLKDPLQNPFLAQFKSRLDADSSLSDKDKQLIGDLVANPGNSGIDLSEDMYMFMRMQGNAAMPRFDMGVLMKMGDKKKFTELLSIVSDGETSEKEQGFELLIFGDDPAEPLLLAYNDEACLFYVAQSGDARQKLHALMDQKHEQSLLADKKTEGLFSKENDMNMYVFMENMPQLAQMPLLLTEMYRNMFTAVSCNFEKGKIVSRARNVFADKDAEKQYLESTRYVLPQTGVLGSYIPSDCPGWMGFGIDGKALYQQFKEIPQYAQLMAMPMTQQLLEAMAGDFAIVFNGMTADGKYPKLSLLGQVNNPAIVDEIVAQFGGMIPVVKTASGSYSIPMGPLPLLIGVKEGILYATIDPAMEQAIAVGGVPGSKPFPFEGKSFGMILDINGLGHLFSGKVPGDVRPAMAFFDLFDRMTLASDRLEGAMEVTMQDKKVNALESMTRGVFDMVMEMQAVDARQ